MRRALHFLRAPADTGAGGADPAGGGAASAGGDSSPQPSPPAAAPPPAARTVMESDATEGDAAELVRLKREKEASDRAARTAQTRVSELEDENRRLKTPPTPTPAPSPKAKKSWLDGATFFDGDE